MRCNKMRTRLIFVGVIGLVFYALPAPAPAVDFEDVSLPGGYYNGADGVGGFVSDNQFLATPYNSAYFSWENVGCSNLTVTTEPTRIVDNGVVDWNSYYASVFPDRELSAIAGSGHGNSANYAVVYPSFSDSMSHITFQQPVQLADVSLTNTNYTYYSIRDGNRYCRAFQAGDYYYVTITGRDINGNVTGSFDYYLADFRNENNLIVNTWQTVALSSLGTNVKSLDLSFTSSDASEWGPNTPTYCALDDLHFVGNPLGASWTGGATSPNWSIPENWGGTLPVAGQSLLFDTDTGGIAHNDNSNHLAGAITFGNHAGAFTLGGNAVRLQYDLTNLSALKQTVDLPLVLVGGNQSVFTALGDIAISQPIGEEGGSFGLTKTGSHTLTLSAVNTYTGPTLVSQGTLALADGGDISTASTISVAAGAMLEIVGGSHLLGTLDGAGTTIVDPGATLTATSIAQDTLIIGSAQITAVPEPGTLVMLSAAVLGLLIAGKRKL